MLHDWQSFYPEAYFGIPSGTSAERFLEYYVD